jgi:predicted GIY-YIG superfamily endonuclease
MTTQATWAVNLKASLDQLPDVPRLRSSERYREWFVYLLADPSADAAFYAGCTGNPRQRLKCHISDPASAAWARIRDMRTRGVAPIMLIVSIHHDKGEAEQIEAHLISTIPGLDNLQGG